MGLDDATLVHVDQVPAQHVGGQQDLAWASLKRLGPDGVGVEPHAARLQAVDEVFADEHVLRADAHIQAAHGRVRAFGQLDDEVDDAADLRSGRVQDRAVQDMRQHQPPFVRVSLRVFHFHAAVFSSFTHRFSPCPPWSCPLCDRSCSASRASGTSHTNSPRAATYCTHHQPVSALTPRPARVTAARYAQLTVSAMSARRDELSRTRLMPCFARARSGMATMAAPLTARPATEGYGITRRTSPAADESRT